jgi:hypothetical protein
MKKQAPKPKNELNIDEFQADPLLGAGGDGFRYELLMELFSTIHCLGTPHAPPTTSALNSISLMTPFSISSS